MLTERNSEGRCFLSYLIEKKSTEWQYFKERETHPLHKEYFAHLELFLSGQESSLNLHSHPEYSELIQKTRIWASCRFQTLLRTVNGFMHIPTALKLLLMIQEPFISEHEATQLVLIYLH